MKFLVKIKEALCYILRPSEVIFRVIDIFDDPLDNQTKVRYHAIGKSISTVEPIKNIVNALAHIQGFCNKDSAILLKRYKKTQCQPFSLESILFNEAGTKFLIRDNDSNEKFEISLMTIERNTEILLQFSHTDAKAIMSLIFNSLFSQEMKKICNLANNNNIPKVVYIRSLYGTKYLTS